VSVAISVDPAVTSRVSRDGVTRLRTRAQSALRAAHDLGLLGASSSVSVLLTTDPAIRVLNRDYRKVDRPTDVLSFSQNEGAPAPQTSVLGDIVLSVDTAARRRKRTLEDELFFLLVHGLLHLCGYDHATRGEARRMFALERAVRARVLGKAD
jgi:probable rRNA maturation factor